MKKKSKEGNSKIKATGRIQLRQHSKENEDVKKVLS